MRYEYCSEAVVTSLVTGTTRLAVLVSGIIFVTGCSKHVGVECAELIEDANTIIEESQPIATTQDHEKMIERLNGLQNAMDRLTNKITENDYRAEFSAEIRERKGSASMRYYHYDRKLNIKGDPLGLRKDSLTKLSKVVSLCNSIGLPAHRYIGRGDEGPEPKIQ